jgi:indolepyruvate ferredoxin oxidoreductase beta subunit
VVAGSRSEAYGATAVLMAREDATINMVIAALGGEGGGVLTNWLIAAAEQSGWWCQSTSLAGVAQRTGATIYYLEFMPRQDHTPPPVMSLFPAQGDIDIAVASEIAEAGRMISRGFISPDKSMLIASDHRVFGITEKSATGDGSVDRELILEMGERYARTFIHFDMSGIVQRQGTVISAALLGAIAGSDALPFAQQCFRDLLSSGGSAAANLAAFDESCRRAGQGGVDEYVPPEEEPFTLPTASNALGDRWLPRIADLPVALHEIAYYSVNRLIDYQDEAYAEEWFSRFLAVIDRDSGSGDCVLAQDTGRYLALWMAFEDIPRVAQLKVRPDREAMIRSEVKAASDQPVAVAEFFHPRIEEVAALLPARWGKVLLSSDAARRCLGRLLGPRTLRTDRIGMQILLRCLAGLRRLRRSTLGYAHERQMIDRWYDAVLSAKAQDAAMAIAALGGLVKGYGETRHRTTSRLMQILDYLEQSPESDAGTVASLHIAAMAPDSDFQIGDMTQLDPEPA